MIEQHDHGLIRTLTLARPPVNALDAGLLEALGAAVAAAPADGIRGLVLTGAGSRFSGGLDVAALALLDEAGLRAFIDVFMNCLRVLAHSPLPMVAAINGASPAGGAVLALYCDRRVMVEGEARIGLNEVQVGLYPGPLIHAVLCRAVGPRLAAEFLTTGAMLTPEAALAAGFVDEVSSAAALLTRAHAWLEGILALPYAATRALVRQDLVALMDGVGGADLDRLAALWSGPETRSMVGALAARLARR
jgi:Delta3-Delta2-enoyl-CoA isomerase